MAKYSIALFLVILLVLPAAAQQTTMPGIPSNVPGPALNTTGLNKQIPNEEITINFTGKIIEDNMKTPLAGYTVHVAAIIGWSNYDGVRVYTGQDRRGILSQTIPSSGIVTGSITYINEVQSSYDAGGFTITYTHQEWFVDWEVTIDGCTTPTYGGYDPTYEIYQTHSLTRSIGARDMYFNINGNSYPTYDLLYDTVMSYFNVNKDEIKNKFRDAIINNVDRTNPAFNAWPDAPTITYSAGPSVNVNLPNIHFDWDWRLGGSDIGTTCRFHLTGNATISFSPQIVREGTKYFLRLIYTGVNADVDVRAQSNQTGAGAADVICAGCGELVNFVGDILLTIGKTYAGVRILCGAGEEIPLGDLAGINFNGVTLTSAQAIEIQNALPLNLSLGVTNGCLSINMNLLNQAGVPYSPPVPRFEYMGFVCPYYAFQTPILSNLSSSDPRAEQENIVINKMADYSAKTFRFSIPWGEVFPTIDLTKVQNPDVLTGSVLDAAIAAIDPNVWSNTDMIFQNGMIRGMEVIPQLLQQERDLPKINGGTIAPDNALRGLTTVVENGVTKQYYYVDANTYLYYAKIFANAAVRRYKDRVGLWAVESEFNAARISTFANWRHGNCWADEGTGGFQERYWRILIDAVRNNDPTAKVASNFHMLNLAGGINRLGADLDIIGVDVYPDLNGQVAYPVMGFMVGEVVRATKTLLQSKGWASKEVHVMETGYAANNTETTPYDGASIDECVKKFSYNRQARYMRDAITSSYNFGAKGFFWWAFLDNEGSKGPEGDLANFVSLMKLDGTTIKPAATAFRDLVPVVYNANNSHATSVVSPSIASNTLWQGTIVVTNNVTISSNATLTINPGTNVFLGPNIKIEALSGSKIIANGTSTNTIKFARLNAMQAWDQINLNSTSPNNQFSYCVFDGGSYANVQVGSSNNTFTTCTFKNAYRVGLQINAGNNSINNCTFQDNWNGTFIGGGSVSFNNNTIRNNTGLGLFVYYATVTCFTNNYIENNGSYGIHLGSGAVLYMGNGSGSYAWQTNPNSEVPMGGAGKNRINNNCRTSGTYEIYVDGSSRLYAGSLLGWNNNYYCYFMAQGFNRITSTTGKYIYNLAMTGDYENQQQWMIPAQKNYWGGTPSGSNFYGSVNFSYPLTTDPTTASGASIQPTIATSGKPGTVLTSAIVDKLSEEESTQSQQQSLVDLKNKMLETRNSLNDPKNNALRPRLIGNLNALCMFDPNNETQEKSAVTALLAEYRNRLLSNPTDMTDRLCSEAALVQEVQNAIRTDDMTSAQDLVKKYSPYVQNDDNKRALLLAEVAIDERLGEYAKAMTALNKVKAFQPDTRQKKGFVAPSYDALEMMLQEKSREAGVTLNDQQQQEQLIPTETALLQNYPNPFNPSTTIQYQLSAPAHVTLKIFDMMGREVALLQEGTKETGSYTATFDASKLASGIYFSRLSVQSQDGKQYLKTMKMLLLK